MGQVHMHGPPDPSEGTWCVACLMRVKQQQWEAFESEIKDGFEKQPPDKQVWIPFPPGLVKELAIARYRAVAYEFPQLGIVDLCWDDVAGINPSKPAAELLTATGPIPPGLLKGRKG